jgi:predicted NBD/HSP70 family sugar kinase
MSVVWHVIHKRSLHLREPNEVRILRLVRDRKALSRIELARATGLHKATVTDLVAKLIRAGYLEDTGEVETRKRVGRKRMLLRFLPMAGLVAGVDIRMTHARVALTDLNARVLAEGTFDYPADAPVEDVLASVASTIRSLLKGGKHPLSALVGIGIGVQGIVDFSTNILRLSYNKKDWQGRSLSEPLEREFNVPVYVENDVKTMALGEYLLGAAKGTKDFVHLWVGEGVGAGIMIGGQLLHGITSSAGEIGFNSLDSAAVDHARFPLTFRGQEIFGEVLTDANLIESYRRHAAGLAGEMVGVPGIAERAQLGDSVAAEVIEEFVSLLGVLSITMVNTLNPRMIVVGGKLAQAYPNVAEMLQVRIHGDLLTPPAEAVRICCAANRENGVVLGAAGLVLYELFEPLPAGRVRAVRRSAGVTPAEPVLN